MLNEMDIRRVIAGINSRVDWMTIDKNASFDSIGLDSLDRYEIIVGMQEAGGAEVPDDDVARLESIASIEEYFAGQ